MIDYYIIPPKIHFEDRKLLLLNTEINNFKLKQLLEIVRDFENVFNGKYDESCFGLEAINVSFDKDKAVIDHYGEVLSEVNSADIYFVINSYCKKLETWEKIENDMR